MAARIDALNLLFVVSLGSLARAGSPVEIAAGTGLQAPKQPQVAFSKDGAIHLVYGSGDSAFCSTSTDGGATFSKPEKAFDCPNMSLGARRGPRIATSGQTVVITAIGGAAGKGRDGDILAWRRSSGGQWTGPVRVNDVADSAREGLHAMASGPDGTLWCCWLDLRVKGAQVYIASSKDAGATWSENRLVYRSPEGSVCPCCHPSIVVGADGRPHILFRNDVNGDRDMYVTSGDGEGNYGPAVKLGDSGWTINRCPMDGGMLAIDSNGRMYTAWRRKDDAFLTNNGREQHLGRGEQPWVAGLNDGPVAVWIEKDDGNLFVLHPHAKSPAVLAEIARDPVVVSLPDGKKAFAAWEVVVDKDRRIVGQIIQ